jgi:hypothetical protein
MKNAQSISSEVLAFSVVTDVSKEHGSYIFKVEASNVKAAIGQYAGCKDDGHSNTREGKWRSNAVLSKYLTQLRQRRWGLPPSRRYPPTRICSVTTRKITISIQVFTGTDV